MALRVTSADVAARRFSQRGAAAAGDYAEGITGSGQNWLQRTQASGDNFAAGVQNAIADKRFEKGVTAAGAAKFENAAKGIGARRFGEGIANAAPSYQAKVAPYLDALRNLDIDSAAPRRPRGDPSNYRRSELVGMKLREVKLGRG